MERKVITAAWEEARLHSLRFTMSDVTRRLRMSKSSLYKLVPSKDALIHEMQSYMIDTSNEKENRIMTSTAPVITKIRDMVQVYLEMMQPMAASGYLEDLRLLYPVEYDRWQEFYTEKVADVMQLLEQGVRDGIFRPVCLPVVQQCLYVSAVSLADTDFLKQYNLTHQQAVETLEDVLFYGLMQTKTDKAD